MPQLSCSHSKWTGSIEFSWHWNQSHVRPQQPGVGLDGVRLDRDAVFEPRVGMGNFFEGLVDALAGVVELPAVVIAPQAALLDPRVGQVGAAVRAVPIDQSEIARQILEDHEVLAEQANGSCGLRVELADGAEGHPVVPQQVAHERARADLHERAILFRLEHPLARLLDGIIVRHYRIYLREIALRALHIFNANGRATRWLSRWS